MSKLKMIFILCFVFLAFFSMYAVKAHAAQLVPTNQSFTSGLVDYAKDNKLNSYAYVVSMWGQNGQSGVCYLVGCNDPKTGITLVPGAVSGMGKAMAYLIKERPAGTDMYLADLIKHAPLTQSAYAQGIGFESLTPILEIWKVFRDLTYVFFVLVFVVIGFMIMFRQKLSGNVVVTVESALPNLIVTLLLITFSYAIAGLLIDVMYLVLYLIVRIFESLIETRSVPLVDIAFTNSIFDTGFTLIFNQSNGGNASTVQNAASAVSTIASGFFESFGVASWINGAASSILGVIGALVFAFAIFFAVVRTFFKLLEAYIGFIIGVIFAPLQLFAGAITGKSTFGDWINNLLANLAVFPVVIVFIFLAMALGGAGRDGVGYKPGADGNISGGFTPPLITLRSTEAGQIAYAFQAIISIGILMLLPEALKMTKEAFHAQGPFDKYVPAITKGLESGFRGGEIIPGMKFTKIPGASGITQGAIKTTFGTGAGALVGGAVGYSSEGKKGLIAGVPIGALAGAVGPKRIISGAQKVNKVVTEGGQFLQNVQKAPDAFRGFSQGRTLTKAKGEGDLGTGKPIGS